MRFPGLAGLLAVVALVAASAAGARTIPLNWIEHASSVYYPAAMTFRVKDVSINAKAWAVHASVTNQSAKRVTIVKPYFPYPPQYSFGLGWAPSCPPPQSSCPLDKLPHTYARPALPKSLGPGKTWSGVFGGPGTPPRGKLINITFGFFVTPDKKSFNWLTSHAFKL